MEPHYTGSGGSEPGRGLGCQIARPPVQACGEPISAEGAIARLLARRPFVVERTSGRSAWRATPAWHWHV